MQEPKTVRMIANVTFTNKQHEGQVRRRSTFFTTERRAKALEKHGHARRAAVGPTMTKPTAPLITKAAARKMLGFPEVIPSIDEITKKALAVRLKKEGVFFKATEKKQVLYDRYLESLNVSA